MFYIKLLWILIKAGFILGILLVGLLIVVYFGLAPISVFMEVD